ncbi:MAG: hypothetical protein MI748_08170, partial [Opitutales bacterium]|nr:hypothetical protein [Opitutales bacterium]
MGKIAVKFGNSLYNLQGVKYDGINYHAKYLKFRFTLDEKYLYSSKKYFKSLLLENEKYHKAAYSIVPRYLMGINILADINV